MKLVSTRRLTGPNRWTMQPAAVGEIRLDPQQSTDALQHFCQQYKTLAQSAAQTVGWTSCEAFAIPDGNYLMVGLYAPSDGLYAACDLVEWVVDALLEPTDDVATHAPESGTQDDVPTLPPLTGKAYERLQRMVERESNPHLVALQDAALARDVPFLQDDDYISLGLGKYAQAWMTNALPTPDALAELPWSQYSPIPVAMITGTNGKTTTARMLARIGRCAGRVVGNTSTDGLVVDEKMLESGDWTGPGGARHILRHQEIDMAVLETARGGMLRRGLACQWADVAVITNVSDDHLGEWGIEDVAQMAEVKLLLRHGRRPHAPLVLNADNAPLRDAIAQLNAKELGLVSWFTLSSTPETLQSSLPCGHIDAWYQKGMLHIRPPARDGANITKIPVSSLPSSMNGAARHNIHNAMAAAIAALATGIDPNKVVEGLQSFRPSVQDSPGRANLFLLEETKIIVDFGHNPAGVKAIMEMVAAMDVKGRRLVLLGQAGDRSDDEIRGLATATLAQLPDQILLKDMLPYLRGRRAWEVTGLMQDVFVEAGIPPHQITTVRSERDAVEWALSWKQPGDLLVLFIQSDIQGTLSHLTSLGAIEL